MELSAASFSYPKHDGGTRAEIAGRLFRAEPLDDGFVLSTCLRVEVVVPGPRDRLDQALFRLLGERGEGLGPDIRLGEDAVAHLFRIAAGLESPILGEQEILTQFRQTVIAAEEKGQVTGLFAKLLESAVSVGRQARDLLPGSPHNSMAAVAAQAVGSAGRVAVLGSGLMATAVMEGLLSLPAPPQITMVARHPEKVGEIPGVEVLSFDDAGKVIEDYPAVVSATSAKRRLLEEDALELALSKRRAPLLLIDMAMPPDFRPSLSDQVIYLAIDDLARMADRRPRSHEADALVESAAAEAHRNYRDHHEVGPLIGGLMRRADDIVADTVRRFAGRLGQAEDEAVLRQSAHTVARTLLAAPVTYIKAGDRPPEALDIIADAFGVDDE